MQYFIVTLLICSVAMSALALVYMAATPFLAKHYSEKWRYYAWLIIMVGLIIPFRPQFTFALFRVEVPSNASLSVVQTNGEAPSYLFPPIDLSSLPSFENFAISETLLNIAWWQIAAAIWLAGALLFITYHGIKHYRFVKVAQRWSENITDRQILSLLESLKIEMGIKQHIPIHLCPFAGSPLMIGILKPRILLPTVELAQDELCFVLKHELVHYKRKDLMYKYLVLAVTAIHWFNPVTHLMAKAVNVLCETSCDAEVLRSADEKTRLLYGETIISVVEYQSKLKTVLSTNFYGGKKGMKNRISSIMDTRKKKAGAIIACLILALTLSTGVVFAATNGSNQAPCIYEILRYVTPDTPIEHRFTLIDEYGNETTLTEEEFATKFHSQAFRFVCGSSFTGFKCTSPFCNGEHLNEYDFTYEEWQQMKALFLQRLDGVESFDDIPRLSDLLPWLGN